MIFSESEIVELKSEVSGDICKEIVAFANSKGGTLYIGVSDDGQVIGVKNADKVTLQINNMIRDSVKPDVTMFVHYETRKVDGKDIVAVTVQKGTNRPYYLGSKGLKPSGVYIRNGTASDPASDTAIRNMIKETDGDSFEDMRSLEQNLTFEVAALQFAKSGVEFDSSKMQTLGLLSSEGVYSNVAMLLSDQCSSTIKTAEFSGTDKSNFQDRREFSGSLFKQMEEMYAYLDIRNRTKATFDGLYRKDTKDYPEEALREALLNSVVQRDYSFGASTLISIYDDRIEFVSVGGLPNGIALEDIMLGLSVCRNPKLAAVFYRLKLIEAYGTGMPKIMNSYKGNAKKPTIEATGNAFKVTLPNRNFADKIYTDANVHESVENRILRFIEANGYITRSDVDTLLNVSQSTSSRILRKMAEKGLIRQEGNGKMTKYRKK